MFGIFANPMRFDPMFYPSSFGFVRPFYHPMKRRFNSRSFFPLMLQSQFERDNYDFFNYHDHLLKNFFDFDGLDAQTPPTSSSTATTTTTTNDNNINNNNNDQKKQPKIYEHHRSTVSDPKTGIIKETEIERINNKWAEKHVIIDKEGKKTESFKQHEDDTDKYEQIIKEFNHNFEKISSFDSFLDRFKLFIKEALPSNSNEANLTQNQLSDEENSHEDQNNNEINQEDINLTKNIQTKGNDQTDVVPQVKEPPSTLNYTSTPENHPKTSRKPKNVVEE